MPATAYLHVVDPKEELLKKIGDVSDCEVFHNQVLCAIYLAPEKTAGGIIRPDSNRDEDKHQGKVALIVKMGPKAFAPDEKWSWPEMNVGDWVYYRVSDGWSLTVNRVLCRILHDDDIRGRVQDPDQVW